MPSRPVSGPPAVAPPEPGARFGARVLLAAFALALVAVPFGLLLFLVQDRWPPLLEVDDGARDWLHSSAVTHAGVVAAMQTLSTLGSAVVYLPLFALVAAWLLRSGRPRLAIFVAVTAAGSAGLNGPGKVALPPARPGLPGPLPPPR